MWWDVVQGEVLPPALEEHRAFLVKALDQLPPEPWDADTWSVWTTSLKQMTGRKGRALFMPLRQAITGEDHGPEMHVLLPLIGRARVAERLGIAAT